MCVYDECMLRGVNPVSDNMKGKLKKDSELDGVALDARAAMNSIDTDDVLVSIIAAVDPAEIETAKDAWKVSAHFADAHLRKELGSMYQGSDIKHRTEVVRKYLRVTGLAEEIAVELL